MKKSYYLLGFLPLFYSCSEIEDLPNVESSVSNVTTRAAGDGVYDVLGYGYDVTGEYLHPMSVRNPVLDINKYEQYCYDRLQYGTSSFGYDQMYYGYSASPRLQFGQSLDQRCFRYLLPYNRCLPLHHAVTLHK